jgi:hypothetical protein
MVKDSSITIFLVLDSASCTVQHKTGQQGQIVLNLKIIFFFVLSGKRVNHE